MAFESRIAHLDKYNNNQDETMDKQAFISERAGVIDSLSAVWNRNISIENVGYHKLITLFIEPRLVVPDIDDTDEDVNAAAAYIKELIFERISSLKRLASELSAMLAREEEVRQEKIKAQPHYLICCVPNSAFVAEAEGSRLEYLFADNLRNDVVTASTNIFFVDGYQYDKYGHPIPKLCVDLEDEFKRFYHDTFFANYFEGLRDTYKLVAFKFPTFMAGHSFVQSRSLALALKHDKANISKAFQSAINVLADSADGYLLINQDGKRDVRAGSEIRMAVDKAQDAIDRFAEEATAFTKPYQDYLRRELGRWGVQNTDNFYKYNEFQDCVEFYASLTSPSQINSAEQIENLRKKMLASPKWIETIAERHQHTGFGYLSRLCFLRTPTSLDHFKADFPALAAASKPSGL